MVGALIDKTSVSALQGPNLTKGMSVLRTLNPLRREILGPV